MKTSGWRTLALSGVTGLCVVACASTRGDYHAYKLYPGPARPGSDLAIVRLADAAVAEFDGRAASRGDWTEVHLLPGDHRIRWQAEFGVSVMIEPTGLAAGGRETDVTLVAGHVYSLRADRTTGPGYRMFFWIRDDTAGQVIAGTPKPRRG
jgi:hypothetical protein